MYHIFSGNRNMYRTADTRNIIHVQDINPTGLSISDNHLDIDVLQHTLLEPICLNLMCRGCSSIRFTVLILLVTKYMLHSSEGLNNTDLTREFPNPQWSELLIVSFFYQDSKTFDCMMHRQLISRI